MLDLLLPLPAVPAVVKSESAHADAAAAVAAAAVAAAGGMRGVMVVDSVAAAE